MQFGDIKFYHFLVEIGLHPAKSKTLRELNIPKENFADFLRGCIDGDGNIAVNNHPESRHLQLKVRLCSASLDFLIWIKNEIREVLGISRGWIDVGRNHRAYYLVYGKEDGLKILRYTYYDGSVVKLSRKYAIACKFIEHGQVAELV